MLHINFILALAAVYDGILYVAQPPNSTSATITFDRSANATWSKMDYAILCDIPVFTVQVKNRTVDGLLSFKIKFNYTTHSIDARRQTIGLKNKQFDVFNKTLAQPTNDYCCISAVILALILLILLSICVGYYFIYWTINYDLHFNNV